jgi:hypothetical protein
MKVTESVAAPPTQKTALFTCIPPPSRITSGIFSSPAPRFVMGVGLIGPTLHLYKESDTILSIDTGMTRAMVHREPHKFEFGDQGGIIVVVNDKEMVNIVSYSTDLDKT